MDRQPSVFFEQLQPVAKIRKDGARPPTSRLGRRESPLRRVNPKAIQEFMGHATIEETFSRYGHLMPGARKQARALIDAYIAAALKDAT